MSLIYPADGQTIGEAIAEVEAVGGTAGNTFNVTRDHAYRTVIDVDDDVYEKWRKKHAKSTSDTSDSGGGTDAEKSAKTSDSAKDTKDTKSKKAR